MRIDYDHDQLAHLVATDSELQAVNTELRGLDLTDRAATRDRGLDLVSELITWTNWHALPWRITGLPGHRLDVGAGFEGNADGHLYLEFFGFLAPGAGIVSPGTDSILDLLDGHDTATPAVILNSIAHTLSTVANDLAALVIRADAAAPESGSDHTAEATR